MEISIFSLEGEKTQKDINFVFLRNWINWIVAEEREIEIGDNEGLERKENYQKVEYLTTEGGCGVVGWGCKNVASSNVTRHLCLRKLKEN